MPPNKVGVNEGITENTRVQPIGRKNNQGTIFGGVVSKGEIGQTASIGQEWSMVLSGDLEKIGVRGGEGLTQAGVLRTLRTSLQKVLR